MKSYLLLFISALSILACGQSQPGTLQASAASAGASEKAAPERPASEKTFSEKDSGSKVALKKAAGFAVRLETIPGAGFTWLVSKRDPALLELVSEDTEAPPPSTVGGPVHKTFRFKALAQGATSLELAYRRPWEKDTPPSKTFTLDITIEP